MLHPVAHLTITIGSPPTINGREGRHELARFYGELLGMRVVREDWLKIAKVDRSDVLHFALDGDGWSDLRPPRWPDPEYPQQMHLDIEVAGIEAAGVEAERLGAKLLQDGSLHRIYVDPAGHPFCLFESAVPAGEPRVARLVMDCFSPRSLARFYEGLFGVERPRVEDSPERVVLSLGDERLPDLAFQHAEVVAPRWPDPAYPAQFHMDVRFADGPEAACERAERLGAIRLPQLGDSQIYADPAAHPFCL